MLSIAVWCLFEAARILLGGRLRTPFAGPGLVFFFFSADNCKN